MTRQRVDPSKRQRTAHACDSCKRRKQKCDGARPCAACLRRQFNCSYSTGGGQHGSPTHVQAQDAVSNSPSPSGAAHSGRSSPNSLSPGKEYPFNDFQDIAPEAPLEELNALLELGVDFQEEETEIPACIQMVRDSHGRAQFMGSSAGPSFLRLVRRLVLTVTDSTHLIGDEDRQEEMVGRPFVADPEVSIQSLLPDREVALVLVDSFFRNTTGTLEILSEKSFLQSVYEKYRNLANIGPVWLCHFYLVLAIGLVLATPLAGSKEASLIHAFNTRHPSRCEEYFLAAKKLCSAQDGLEDAKFWSVQALAMMSWFALCRSLGDRAYTYTGMAIRSSYALGLHRPESLMLFEPSEQDDRKRTWRTLFLLDVFLADSLGRPMSISESELSSPILNPSAFQTSSANGSGNLHVCAAGLEASLVSFHMISQILRKIYTSTSVRISTLHDISVLCRTWPQKRASFLSWQDASPHDVRRSIAILHCNLNCYHTIILFSRPLLLQLLTQELRKNGSSSEIQPITSHELFSRYAMICVKACAQTVHIINAAFMGGYLPRRNPLVRYHLVGAAIVIIVNELLRPGSLTEAHQLIEASLEILGYCAVLDSQAAQQLKILEEMRSVIAVYQAQRHQSDPWELTCRPQVQHVPSQRDTTETIASSLPGRYDSSAMLGHEDMDSSVYNPDSYPTTMNFGHHAFPGYPPHVYVGAHHEQGPALSMANSYQSLPHSFADSADIRGRMWSSSNRQLDEAWQWDAGSAPISIQDLSAFPQ